MDLWICAVIRDKRVDEEPTLTLWLAVENKVGSTENEYEKTQEEIKQGARDSQSKIIFQTERYWELLRNAAEKSNDHVLVLPVFLVPIPQSEYDKYLSHGEEKVEGIAHSKQFFTLNYQYLLDGVLELAREKNKNSYATALIEDYIHCLGRAVDSDENSGENGKDTIVMWPKG